MSLSLAENVIVVGADNRPPMLDKINYNSWASQLETETTLTIVRARTYTDLTDEEKLHESVDITVTNIILQGLPQDIYNLVNHNEDAKRIWDRVKLLIQGSELSLQERESKLYDDFDTFTYMLGETIHLYYMRFSQLINDMHTIRMTMKPLQVNTKFVNHLQPEWSKFITDIKLAKDMHTTNFDHLFPDQIALVANSPSCLNPTQYYPQLSSTSQQSYPSPAPQRSNDAPIVQQLQYQPQVSTHSQAVQQQTYQAPALQQSYQAPAIHQPMQPSFPELDSGLVVLPFNPYDDPIASLNKAMVFLSATFASRFPQTNNQLRTLSNPRNQATIQDERVTVQGRQRQGYAKNGARNTATNSGVNRKGAPVQARVVKCYNCQEEGHFARQL
ncbi:retrovirus-related pol polyprotein from transposon TNT 1-94 [Tanacetum coccineum]